MALVDENIWNADGNSGTIGYMSIITTNQIVQEGDELFVVEVWRIWLARQCTSLKIQIVGIHKGTKHSNHLDHDCALRPFAGCENNIIPYAQLQTASSMALVVENI